MSAPHESTRVELGTIKQYQVVAIPGDFASAVTLIVSVTVEGIVPPPPPNDKWGFTPSVTMGWSLRDSLDGKHWQDVDDTEGNRYGTGIGKVVAERVVLHETRRFVLPVAPQLAIEIWLDVGRRELPPSTPTMNGVAVQVFSRII
jgi:hypothetical protein